MQQKDIAVRPMAESDIAAVLAIQAVCYTAIVPESADSLLAKRRASPGTCLIATCAGEAVGYLIALPWQCASPPLLNAPTCRLPRQPDCLYLHDLAVSASARASGAGRALVEAFLHKLQELDLGRASLVAIQDSAAYWARYGFRAVPASGPLQAKLASYGAGVQYMERPPTRCD
ncbi:MAG: GNAT family N-acetyltransferase [Betaproteobacteria bacterium HGW-Betaproteobacteria-12]|nr:MAG: GNAT family N-acetyltransferase [Betaproteobacteria bacterium HGW-Betaproteobacteria-12]